MPRFLVLLGMWVVLLAAVVAAEPPALRTEINDSKQSLAVDNTTFINANNILMFVTNHGVLGRDLAVRFGYDYGTFYPYVSVEAIESGDLSAIKSPLYACGLWLCGVVNNDILVAIAEYDDEFTPGPMLNGTFQSDRPSFKVYHLYDDSLENNPNNDYLNWPIAQGAPLNNQGKPKSIGKQTLWTVYNDANPAGHNNNAGETDPLGVEIQKTVWVFADEGGSFVNDLIFIQYKLYNKGGKAINNMHIAFWSDPDLGGPGDDLVGCDTLNDLFYCYNSTARDLQYGATPPAVGFKILCGPMVPSPGDSAYFDGHYIQDFKNLGMTSFQKYINGTDPYSPTEVFNYATGLTRDGSPLSNGTKYAVPGNPVNGTGDIDNNPADRRMMGTCGPITMLSGDSQFVLIKMGVGQGGDRLTSITELKRALNTEFPVLPAQLKAICTPEPMSIIMKNGIPPMHGYIRFGYDKLGFRGKNIDYSSLALNSSVPLDSVAANPHDDEFNGESAIISFPLREFLDGYGLVYDTLIAAYTISGTYEDGTALAFEGQVSILGHSRRDVNLDGTVDISDLLLLVDYMFNGNVVLSVPEAADINDDGQSDITDLLSMVEYAFR